ncbi:hypothetical protein MOQ_000968 [Trypanosoma cruzi marinkellei]|uniref:Uncharacterized protein n=1 Tax=Trypanosoma cruzi marinkellei TaxID=85056 RepID=K2NHF2_TRYCR|nr:hypothetical protein MOQ_000968 [Trypanosoma cruzi marinkellei]
MRCGGGHRVTMSVAATAFPVTASSSFFFCYRRCCISTDRCAATAPQDPGLQALLQQLRRRFARAALGVRDEAAANVMEESDAVRSHENLSLRQILKCCEEVCNAERPLASSPEEWSETVQLLLYALARGKRENEDESVKTQDPSAENSTPWCVSLRLFLHTAPSGGDSQAENPPVHPSASCVSLLRCCVRHGAPVNVVRAVYQTLRLSVPAASESPVTGWHVPYARFLLMKAAAEEMAVSFAFHKEALRVLLLDAAEDGEMLQPAGMLLSLEVLQRLVTWRKNEEGGNVQDNVGMSTVEDALWSRLQRGTDVVSVARDVCCCVIYNRSVSHAMKREAFCLFIAVGMRLPLEELRPFLWTVHREDVSAALGGKVTPQNFLETLQAVTEILSKGVGGGVASYGAVMRALAEPSNVMDSRSKAVQRFVLVWLVDHIVKGLASLQGQVITVGSAKNSSHCAVESWAECTHAALRCLQRLFLHLPDGRHGPTKRRQHEFYVARQRAFRLLFHAALNGVFYTFVADSASSASARSPFLDVMSVLIQVYGEHDWRQPSVDMFIECLHAWHRHDVLRRVFRHVCRKDERRWRVGHKSESTGDGTKEVTNSSRRWRSSFRISTCLVVVESSCLHDDPTTAAIAVRHMLRSLLAVKFSEQPAQNVDNGDDVKAHGVNVDSLAKGRVLEGQSVAAWTQFIREDIIPRVNEVFCRTGTDTTQQWLGDLDAESHFSSDAEAMPDTTFIHEQ